MASRRHHVSFAGRSPYAGGADKAFGRLADQAIPLSLYGKTVGTADAVSAAADLAHDRVDAVEKMGEEGASAALWIGQTSYTAPQCAMIFLKSAVSRIRAKLKTATSAVVRKNFCPCFFAEEAVGTQPAASGKLS